MPRGRRKAPANPTEEIERIDEKISVLQNQIGDLKKKKKEIESRINDVEKQKVLDAFLKSGKSVEDFLSPLSYSSNTPESTQ